MTRVVIAGSLLLLLLSCVTGPSVDTPSGFAAFPDADEPLALSPEGVGFRLRSVANDPEQTLAFWGEALDRHMSESGYLRYDETGFDSNAGPGVAFEWLAPVNDEDWVYLTAIVVTGERILIAEAAGPVELYLRHRPALVEALETISDEE